MSDLDVLEEIAEQTAFGTGNLNPTRVKFRRPHSEVCGAGHVRTPENTRSYKQGNRIRTVCRICDKARATKKRRVRYSARDYPL